MKFECRDEYWKCVLRNIDDYQKLNRSIRAGHFDDLHVDLRRYAGKDDYYYGDGLIIIVYFQTYVCCPFR